MKRILPILLILAVLGAGIGFYMYNKPHQNIQKSRADIQVSATELFTAFDDNEESANQTYLDKVVEVKGVVAEVTQEDNGITSVRLDSGSDMFGIICQLDNLSEHKRTEFKTGEEVTFKGICTGMLLDVILVRCVEI